MGKPGKLKIIFINSIFPQNVNEPDNDLEIYFNKHNITWNWKDIFNYDFSNDYYGFLNTFKYDKEKLTLDKYTIIEKARTRVVYNWLQYFSKDSLREEFEENGFEAEDFYSDVTGSTFSPESPDIAIVAIKAKST